MVLTNRAPSLKAISIKSAMRKSGRRSDDFSNQAGSFEVFQPEQARPKSLLDYPPEQRMRLYDTLNKENFARFMAGMQSLTAQLPVEEQVAVLAAVERCGSRRDSEFVARFLDSDNSELLTTLSMRCVPSIPKLCTRCCRS